MSILSNFYTPEIINDSRYKFSSSGQYYAPPKGSYEVYVDFIKELPAVQLPEVFGMDDNVDISKELQETKIVCVCVGRGRGGRGEGGGEGERGERRGNCMCEAVVCVGRRNV